MSFSAVKDRLQTSHWLVIGLLALCAVVLIGQLSSVVRADDTSINTRVCGPSPSLSVAQPISDSTVSQSTVDVLGQVAQISQVEIVIDGEYTQTVAIGFSQTDFQTTVNLSQGTHTIEFIGYDVCSSQTINQIVVMTYQPPVNPNPPTGPVEPPSQGSDVPTQLPAQPGGVIVGTPISGDVSQSSAESVTPSFLDTLLRLSDIETIGKGNVFLNILRLIVVVAGMFLIVGASGIVGLLARWRSNEYKSWHLRLVQMAGLVLIVGALIL